MDNRHHVMQAEQSQSDEDRHKVCDERVAATVHVKTEEATSVASQSQPVKSPDAEFRRGLEELVRDHLDSCMALAGSSSSFQTLQEDDEPGCSGQQKSDVEGDDCCNHSETQASQEHGGRQGQLVNRWYERRAEQVITTMERQARQAELLALAGLHAVSMLDSSFLRDTQHGRSEVESVERPQPRRTSPLLQMWRELECDRRGEGPARSANSQVEESSSDSNDESQAEAEQLTETRQATVEEGGEIGEAARASVRQIINRWMNERVATDPDTSLSRRERNEVPDLNERERVRELAREWLRSNGQQRAEAEAEAETTVNWEAERRRDRQLILDLIMRSERERQQELEGLSEHRAVSRFPYRGRLQSLLRGRFLVNSIRQEEREENVSSAAGELGQLRQRRAVSGLREGFRSRLETIIRGQASGMTSENSVQNEGSEDRWNPTHRMHTLEDATDAELRELLGRRSVTNILASEFRERLDHLIRSFIRRQVPWPEAQRTQQNVGQQTEREPGQDAGPPAQAPPPPPPPLPMQPVWQPDFVQGQWPRPSARNGFMMWDNTIQLRADISRLQQGLGDLQRLVETCLDMQLELQRSIRQEVAGAMQRMYDAGKGFTPEFSDGSQWAPVRKGICCICCDKSIDSLLYRCGHMCMCLNCANTLMQSGSKCPMCRAAIVEVVRAYTVA